MYNHKNLFSHSSGGQTIQIKVWARLAPFGGSQEKQAPGLSQLLGVAGNAWPPWTCRHTTLISASLCLFPFYFSSKELSLELRAHPDPGWSHFFFLFFTFLATPQHMELLGQGSDLSHSCNLCQAVATLDPLTHCAGPGIEPASWHYRDTADPTASQQELQDDLGMLNLFHLQDLFSQIRSTFRFRDTGY